MNIHENARLTPIGRERLAMAVLSGQTPEAAAQAARSFADELFALGAEAALGARPALRRKQIVLAVTTA